MTKISHVVLLTALLFSTLSCSVAFPQIWGQNSERVLEEIKMIETYSIFTDRTPILDRGVLKDPYKVTKDQFKTIHEGGIHNLSEIDQFIPLKIITSTTHPDYTIHITTEGVGARVVEHLEGLWDHASGLNTSFVNFIEKEYTHSEQDLWVQFLCTADGHFPVTIGITPKTDSVLPYMSKTVHDTVNFTIMKTCLLGYRRDFVITPKNIWGSEAKPYHLLEILGHPELNKSDIILTDPRTAMEISVLGPPQIMVLPHLTSQDPSLSVNLLGKGVKGGVAREDKALQFIFSFDCHQVNRTQEPEHDLRNFTFSFVPPPFERVDIPMAVDCKNLAKATTFYPFVIETAPGARDVIQGGKTLEGYKKPTKDEKHSLVVVPPEVGASEFYVNIETGPPTSKDALDEFHFDWFEKIELTHKDDIMKPEVVNTRPNGIIVTKDPMRMVIVYNCFHAGSTEMTVSFVQHDHGYDFTFVKQCKGPTKPKSTSSFWKFLFAFGVIAFGCFLVTVLRAMIHKEHSDSHSAEKATSPKRKIEAEMSSVSTDPSRVSHYEDNI